MKISRKESTIEQELQDSISLCRWKLGMVTVSDQEPSWDASGMCPTVKILALFPSLASTVTEVYSQWHLFAFHFPNASGGRGLHSRLHFTNENSVLIPALTLDGHERSMVKMHGDVFIHLPSMCVPLVTENSSLQNTISHCTSALTVGNSQWRQGSLPVASTSRRGWLHRSWPWSQRRHQSLTFSNTGFTFGFPHDPLGLACQTDGYVSRNFH